MTTTDADTATLNRYADDLVSGAVLARAATSERSRGGYQAPIAARQYAAALAALARYAGRGDQSAATVAHVLPNLNLYATPGDFLAKVADALADVARSGYDDVIGRTGPDAGPASSHHRPTTLVDGINLALLYDEVEAAVEWNGTRANVGWVLAALVASEGVRVHGLPVVAAALGQA